MGSFGTTEIILILIVGFLLLGPKGLSKMAKMIGSLFGELTKMRDDVMKSVNDVKDDLDDIISPVDVKKHNFKKEIKELSKNPENKNKKSKDEV